MAKHPNKHIREAVMKYEFSLILTADVTDEEADKLYEAGCDDGSILSRDGVTTVQFDRHAGTLDEALASAICDVESVGFDVARVEIDRHEVPQTNLKIRSCASPHLRLT